MVQLRSVAGGWQDVGHLISRNEVTRFESTASYWELADRPVLGQVFEENGPGWRPSQRIALPTWFSHLLPEGYLRSAVATALGVNIKREYPLLVRLGESDLPGAVRVVPHGGEVSFEGSDEPVDHAEDEDVDDPVLKFSLAGVQPKFSVLLRPDRGLTIPARGQAGDWIAKLPDRRPGFTGVPEVEYACLEFARAVGLRTPEAMLVDVSKISGLPAWARATGDTALAVKRFDRTPGAGRVHTEVFAQVLSVPTANERAKYLRANFETIASLAFALCGPAAVQEVLARITYFILIGNGDAHLKNWALTYPDGRLPELSPAYDIVSTVLYIKQDDLGLKLGASRAFEDVALSSFDRLASRAGLDARSVHEKILAVVETVHARWELLGELLTVEAFEHLTKRRDHLPLFRGRRSA